MQNDHKDSLSLCLIARDEDAYLQEWLDYHILAGVERFYIYDNESQNSIKKQLSAYIQKSWLIVHEVKGMAQQLSAYDHCLSTYGSRTKWMAFIDADEFLVPKQHTDLKEFLKEYDSFGGLAVSSMFFGSNGHKQIPPNGQLGAYLTHPQKDYPWNRWVKCIVQPEKTAFPDSPHGFTFLRPGAYCVNEQGLRVDNQQFPNWVEKIQLNHYICRSQAEIVEKLKQRKVGGAGRAYQQDRFDEINRQSTVRDESALRFLENRLSVSLTEDDVQCLPDLLHAGAEKLSPVGKVQQQGEGMITPDADFLKYRSQMDRLTTAYNERDLETAIHLTGPLLERFPDKLALHTSLGNLYMHQGRLDEAWGLFATAYKISPQAYTVLDQLAHFFILVNNQSEAEKVLVELLRQGPDEASNLFRMAYVAGLQQKEDLALELGERVLLDPIKRSEVMPDMAGKLASYLAGVLEKRHQHKKARKMRETAGIY